MSSEFPWPERHAPADCPVSSSNELLVDAPPAAVWDALVAAPGWPAIYGNAKRVEIDGGGDRLTDGVTFRWTTFGLRVETTVTEFVPARRPAWYGEGYGSSGYHSWTLHPPDDGRRTLFVTEETQRGIVPWLARWYLTPALHRWHQRWLEGLARAATAESGVPDLGDAPP